MPGVNPVAWARVCGKSPEMGASEAGFGEVDCVESV